MKTNYTLHEYENVQQMQQIHPYHSKKIQTNYECYTFHSQSRLPGGVGGYDKLNCHYVSPGHLMLHTYYIILFYLKFKNVYHLKTVR
jgi:hypothetical protein